MKATDRPLPAMVGDWPDPVGFVEIGTLAGDGFKLKHPDEGHRRIRTSRSVNVSLRVDFADIDRLLVGCLLGGPLALLAYECTRINPHWYLEGDDQ